jgi:hypothetical protein
MCAGVSGQIQLEDEAWSKQDEEQNGRYRDEWANKPRSPPARLTQRGGSKLRAQAHAQAMAMHAGGCIQFSQWSKGRIKLSRDTEQFVVGGGRLSRTCGDFVQAIKPLIIE